jgi:hypothetical protein
MRRNSSSPQRGGRAAVLVALVVASLVGGARPAAACSCMAPAPPETALAEADAVFVGEVTDVNAPAGTTHVAQLAVTEILAGDVGAEVEVHTPPDSAACGYPFEVGREELVYAVLDDDGRLQTNLCDRTAPVAEADDDLAALGEGSGPAALPQDDGPPGWLVPVTGAVALAAAAAVAVVVSRRRRTRPEQP